MKRFILLFLAIVAMHNLWATTYIFTITSSDFNNTSYAANNGEHTSIARNPLNALDSRSVKWYSNQVMLMNGVIQFQKNSGYIYNITSLSYIKEVKVNSTFGTFTTYYGSEQHPTETISENPSFFTVQNGSTAGIVTSIVVTIEAQGGNNNGNDEKPGETANNVIAYTASEKLAETTYTYNDGLYTNAFNVSITSHIFSNGIGTITFSGDVTSIGEDAFKGCSGLTSITIPDSVTSIGKRAFEYCDGLTSITIPNSVTSIGEEAFKGCSGLTSIVWNAKNCPSAPFSKIASQITNFTIGDEVVSIPASLCSSMSKLTSITISNSVTSIGNDAFYGCSGLTAVHISDLAAWCGIEFSHYTANPLYIAHHLYLNGAEVTDLIIPNSVTNIGDYAFSGCSGLKSVTIHESVTSIGGLAFYACSGLTSITIPNSVTSIGDWTFLGCSSLTSITIPNSVKSIGHEAFRSCSGLTSIIIPNSVTSIGERTFLGCSSLTSITIPNSVKSIGAYAFSDCSGLTAVHISDLAAWCGIEFSHYTANPLYIAHHLYLNGAEVTDLIIPNSVTSIGNHAFAYCSGLTSINIPNSVTSIGEDAFYGCRALKSITIPNSVTSIGAYAFSDCSGLTSVTIGNSVTSIGRYAFSNCSGLTSINIPNSVTSIGDVAFKGCTSLKTIYNHSKLHINKRETTNGYVGYYADEVYNYVCGDKLTWDYEESKLIITGSGDMYDFAENDMPWNFLRDEIRSIIINDGVTSIGTYAFSGLSKRGNFTQIAFPSSLLSIGEYAFAGDSYLKSIHFGASVESIGDYAFQGCTRVSEMTCLSELTPEITAKALEDISSDAYLYVPSDYLREYQLDPNWKRFVLMTLGAETTTATEVTVTPYDNEATFTWPTSDNAATYTIEITKDGVVFCTLVFNANGQLTGIAFAPSRNGGHNAPAAQASATGMSFTVTGLSTASHYAYSIQAKSANNQVIASYSGEFSTNGYVEESPTSIEETTVNKYVNTATKILRDGQLFILREGKTYNMQGAVVE